MYGYIRLRSPFCLYLKLDYILIITKCEIMITHQCNNISLQFLKYFYIHILNLSKNIL